MLDAASYLVPSAGERMHLDPEGASLEYSRNGGRWRCEINGSAVAILEAVDGRTSVHDLMQWLKATSPDPDRAVEEGTSFLTAAIERGILSINSSPLEQPIRVTGTRAYFAPEHVMMELTSDCNLKCEHCYNKSGFVKHPRMATAELLTLLKRFAADGTRMVELTGGEPLLHPDVYAIIASAVELIPKVAVLTNGWLIDESMAEFLGERRKSLLVQVDLDGATPATHDHLRGRRGAFKHAQRAISLLSKHGVTTRAAMSVSPMNLHELRETIALAHDLGATLFSHSFVLPVGRGAAMQLGLSELDLRFAADAVAWADDAYPKFIMRPDARLTATKRRNCGGGYRSCVVSPVGDVRPCAMMADFGVSMGNILERGFEGVFGSPMTRFLRELEDPRSAPECEGCSHAASCGSCTLGGLINHRYYGEGCAWGSMRQADKNFGFDAGAPSLGCGLATRSEGALRDLDRLGAC